MKYKCIIFDLDGTLLDSLHGILDAVNLTFKQLGFNVERSYDEAKSFIGAGAIQFAKRAMAGQNIPIEKERIVMEKFLENYAVLQDELTKPFVGVIELLKSLVISGYHIAIASNKPQILLDPIVRKLFPDIKFSLALGQNPKMPEKPDPFCIFKIMDEVGVKPEECVYVGDSEYDYMTAHNAGIDCVICKYGYGFYDKPWFKKIKTTISNPLELLNVLSD